MGVLSKSRTGKPKWPDWR